MTGGDKPDKDADLWRQVAQSTTPLSGKAKTRLHANPPGGKPKPARPRATANAAAPKPAAKPNPPRPKPAPQTTLAPNETRKLQKGRQPIEGRLDLHGMTADRARVRLSAFVQEQQALGHRFVLVITGKGARGEGVLRREVPLWLTQPPLAPLVVAYQPAAPAHGGGGALYVRLRRRAKL